MPDAQPATPEAQRPLSVRDRTRARRLALQVLYQLDVTGDNPDPVHREYIDRRTNRAGVREYAWLLIDGCRAARSELDALLAQHAQNWSIDRMAPIDRNVLRLGAYELLYIPDVPPTVAIDEAIELAKRYGGGDSAAFVNAVLDAIRKGRTARA
jgi:transcription antitermination factor NusB